MAAEATAYRAAPATSAWPGPRRAIIRPPIGGNTSLDPFPASPFSARALTMFFFGTVFTISDNQAGSISGNDRPMISAYARMCQVWTLPDMTTTARPSVTTAMYVVATAMTWRRSHLSATIPPTGARKRNGRVSSPRAMLVRTADPRRIEHQPPDYDLLEPVRPRHAETGRPNDAVVAVPERVQRLKE